MNSLSIPNSISVFRGFASLQVPTVILRNSAEKRLHREQGPDQVENKTVQNDQYLTWHANAVAQIFFSAATAESHHIFNFYRIGHKVGRIIGLHKTKISFQVSTSESFV